MLRRTRMYRTSRDLMGAACVCVVIGLVAMALAPAKKTHYTDPEGTIYIVSGAGGKYKKRKPTKHCGPTAFFRDEVLLWTQVFVEGLTCTIRTWESRSGDAVDEVVITKTRLASNTPR